MSFLLLSRLTTRHSRAKPPEDRGALLDHPLYQEVGLWKSALAITLRFTRAASEAHGLNLPCAGHVASCTCHRRHSKPPSSSRFHLAQARAINKPSQELQTDNVQKDEQRWPAHAPQEKSEVYESGTRMWSQNHAAKPSTTSGPPNAITRPLPLHVKDSGEYGKDKLATT